MPQFKGLSASSGWQKRPLRDEGAYYGVNDVSKKGRWLVILLK
jgi:hypothetical protein